MNDWETSYTKFKLFTLPKEGKKFSYSRAIPKKVIKILIRVNTIRFSY